MTAVLEPRGGETIRPGFQIKVGRPELVLTESIYQPGFHGPDPHVHHDHVDCFFVLDGQFLIDLEDKTITLNRQQGYVVPKGVVHRTRAPQRAVILMVETAAIVPTGD